MTNQEFIQFVLEDRRAPYNDQLLNLASKYFKLVVEDLEKRNNFNYMRRDAYATLLANNNFISFSENIKQFREVINKSNGFKLLGDEDTKALYLYQPDKRGIPRRYYYDSSSKKLYFDVAVEKDTDYILSYYVYTYDTNLVAPTSTHPMLNENMNLLLHGLSYWIERYFTSEKTLEQEEKALKELFERSVQLQQRYTKTIIKVDWRRY